ncbi:MAG: LamG domain-containing protein, partial [Cyanobacteria bacterium J06626_26]
NYQLILASTLTLQPPLWQTIETHPIWRQPLPQTALAFDGEHHFLALDGFTAQSSSFAIEAWINNTQADNETRPRQETPILWRGRAADSQLDGDFETDYELRITAEGQLAFYYGAAAPLLATNTILVNRFTHVAVTVDEGDETTLRLWIDGDLVAEIIETADLPNSGPILMAGRGNATGSVEFFRGLLQEVRLWSKALTETELKESLHQPLTQPEQQSDLIGYWPLATLNDQGLTPDLSGQANPFRLGGLTTSRRPDIVALGTPTVGFLDPSALVLTLTKEQAEALAKKQAEDPEASSGELPEILPKTLAIPPFNATVNPHRQQRTIEVWFQTESPLLARSQTIYQEGDDQRGLKIVVEAGLLKFIDYYPATAGGQRQENIIQTDQIQAHHWHHAAIVINARADVQDYGFCAVLDGQVIDALPGAHLAGAIAPIAIGGLTFTPVIDPVATDLLASDPAVLKTGSWHTTAAGYLHDRGKLKG